MEDFRMISKSIKTVGLLALLVMGLSFTGCDLFSSENESPSIEGFGLVNQSSGATLEANQQYTLTGMVKDDNAIDKIEVTIDGDALSISQNYKGEKKWDYDKDANEQSITIPADLAAGDHTLKITVTDEDGSEVSSSFSFKTEGTMVTKDISEHTLTAGSNGNANHGSSIDLDAGMAYKMADAASKVSDLDICYAYSGVASQDKLFSPDGVSDFDFANGWSNPSNTKFAKLSISKAEFDAIQTKAEINELWSGVTANSDSKEAKQGDVFIVETTEGAKALLYINAQTSGKTGTIEVKVAL